MFYIFFLSFSWVIFEGKHIYWLNLEGHDTFYTLHNKI